MALRTERLHAFLARAGRDPGALAPLAGDASNRRYLRLADRHGPAVVMDAPPGTGEDVRPFLAVTRALRARGLSAPAVLAEDPEAGFLLLEDLGDALFARVAPQAGEETLYPAAVDLLAGHLSGPPDWIAPYDAAALAAEARLVLDWYLAGATGRAPGAAMAEEFLGLLAEALGQAARDRSALVLRDYHAENLIWLPGRTGAARSGSSTTRTRWPVIRPTTSSRCSRMRAATPPPPCARRWSRASSPPGRISTRRPSAPPMPRWARSATSRSSASSRASACATASRAISR